MIEIRIATPQPGHALGRMAARLPKVLRSAMTRALAEGLQRARAAMSPGGGGPQRRTGRLAASLNSAMFQDGDDLVGRLSAHTAYAAAQEYGANIQAKRAEYLKFRVAGRWVQVKKVVLPARPYLGPGAEQAARELEGLVLQALMEE